MILPVSNPYPTSVVKIDMIFHWALLTPQTSSYSHTGTTILVKQAIKGNARSPYCATYKKSSSAITAYDRTGDLVTIHIIHFTVRSVVYYPDTIVF